MSDDRNGKTPTPTGARAPTAHSTHSEIDAFLSKVKSLAPATEPGRRGRLIFALDATMSRQPLWDTACQLQADMFREAAAIGGLDIQLVYYRGLSECRASPWGAPGRRLGPPPAGSACPRGHTPARQGDAPAQHARQ